MPPARMLSTPVGPIVGIAGAQLRSAEQFVLECGEQTSGRSEVFDVDGDRLENCRAGSSALDAWIGVDLAEVGVDRAQSDGLHCDAAGGDSIIRFGWHRFNVGRSLDARKGAVADVPAGFVSRFGAPQRPVKPATGCGRAGRQHGLDDELISTNARIMTKFIGFVGMKPGGDGLHETNKGQRPNKGHRPRKGQRKVLEESEGRDDTPS